MARGSPDHTISIDNHHTHYLIKTVQYAWDDITTLLDWTEVLNVNIQGVFGWLWWAGDNPHVYVRLIIDDNVIFLFTIEQMMNLGAFGCQNSWDKIAVLRYDAINDFYYCIYDEKWAFYVHSNLTVEITYELGQSGKGMCRVYYKELSLT